MMRLRSAENTKSLGGPVEHERRFYANINATQLESGRPGCPLNRVNSKPDELT
jgi:hypothetical protein